MKFVYETFGSWNVICPTLAVKSTRPQRSGRRWATTIYPGEGTFTGFRDRSWNFRHYVMKYKLRILNSWGIINVRSIQFLHVHKITTEPIKTFDSTFWNYGASHLPRHTGGSSNSSKILRTPNTCDRQKQAKIAFTYKLTVHNIQRMLHNIGFKMFSIFVSNLNTWNKKIQNYTRTS